MQMTMAEKREFLERMQELVKHNILRKEDRDAIYRICLAACHQCETYRSCKQGESLNLHKLT